MQVKSAVAPWVQAAIVVIAFVGAPTAATAAALLLAHRP